MTGLVDSQSHELSLSLNQIAEHIYFHFPAKNTFEEHLVKAKLVAEYLLEEGLVEVDSFGNLSAKLRIEGHSLPEMINRAVKEVNIN